MPISWKNINAPQFNNSALSVANTGFAAAAGGGAKMADIAQLIRGNRGEDATNRDLAMLGQAKNPEELAQLKASIMANPSKGSDVGQLMNQGRSMGTQFDTLMSSAQDRARTAQQMGHDEAKLPHLMEQYRDQNRDRDYQYNKNIAGDQRDEAIRTGVRETNRLFADTGNARYEAEMSQIPELVESMQANGDSQEEINKAVQVATQNAQERSLMPSGTDAMMLKRQIMAEHPEMTEEAFAQTDLGRLLNTFTKEAAASTARQKEKADELAEFKTGIYTDTMDGKTSAGMVMGPNGYEAATRQSQIDANTLKTTKPDIIDALSPMGINTLSDSDYQKARNAVNYLNGNQDAFIDAVTQMKEDKGSWNNIEEYAKQVGNTMQSAAKGLRAEQLGDGQNSSEFSVRGAIQQEQSKTKDREFKEKKERLDLMSSFDQPAMPGNQATTAAQFDQTLGQFGQSQPEKDYRLNSNMEEVKAKTDQMHQNVQRQLDTLMKYGTENTKSRTQGLEKRLQRLQDMSPSQRQQRMHSVEYERILEILRSLQ